MAIPGWQDLIVCDTNCNYTHLLLLAKNLITDLVILSTFIAIALFAYAGFKMLLAQGSEDSFKKAITMFQKLGWGYLWILVAWLVVYTISKALLDADFILLTP